MFLPFIEDCTSRSSDRPDIQTGGAFASSRRHGWSRTSRLIQLSQEHEIAHIGKPG